MNKRDIIIVAVLLNAGLLAVLFVMATQTDEEELIDQKLVLNEQTFDKPIPIQIHDAPVMPYTQTISNDELDHVLKDYAIPPQTLVMDDDGVEEMEKEPMLLSPVVAEELHQDKYVEITVKRGDALERIARANGTTPDAIKKLNNLSSERLNIGQVLKIPLSGNKSNVEPVRPKPVSEASKGDEEYYIVKSGDNPWKIAKQFRVRFDELLKLNNLDEEKARNMQVGDKIRVK